MNAVVAFPRPKKRGAKLRKGPLASLLCFPMHARLHGDALKLKWSWLSHIHMEWRNEERDGAFEDEAEKKFALNFLYEMERIRPKDWSEDQLREQVKEMRGRIGKRTIVKDWLEAQGVDWDHVHGPEDALFFVYDMLRHCSPPPAA